MKDGDESTLVQLLKSLDDLSSKLEKAYKEKNYPEFDNSKKMIIKIQERILEDVQNG